MKGAFEMVWHGFLAKAVPTVVTGVVGVAAYEALRKIVKTPLREATVTAVACSMRGVRKAEVSAERARLMAADVFAEAKERAGEEVAPLTVADSSDDHDH